MEFKATHDGEDGKTEQLCSDCLASARRSGQLGDESEQAIAIMQVIGMLHWWYNKVDLRFNPVSEE